MFIDLGSKSKATVKQYRIWNDSQLNRSGSSEVLFLPNFNYGIINEMDIPHRDRLNEAKNTSLPWASWWVASKIFNFKFIYHNNKWMIVPLNYYFATNSGKNNEWGPKEDDGQEQQPASRSLAYRAMRCEAFKQTPTTEPYAARQLNWGFKITIKCQNLLDFTSRSINSSWLTSLCF